MKALIITGKLATYSEYAYAVDRLDEAYATLDIAVRGKETVYGELKGPAGLVQAGPIIPTMDIADLRLDVTSLPQRMDDFTREPYGIPLNVGDKVIAGRRKLDYDLLVLPGGAKAMEYLRQDRDVIDYIAAFHAAGGVIASICHAAQLLISAKLVKGRRISGYYSIRDDIENAGGTFVDGVVVDDQIVSAPHYRFNGRWMAAALRVVGRA